MVNKWEVKTAPCCVLNRQNEGEKEKGNTKLNNGSEIKVRRRLFVTKMSRCGMYD